jgi:hypothetical protein
MKTVLQLRKRNITTRVTLLVEEQREQLRFVNSSTFRIRPFVLFPLELISTTWTGDQPCRKAATYTGQHRVEKPTDINVSSGIRNHNLSI